MTVKITFSRLFAFFLDKLFSSCLILQGIGNEPREMERNVEKVDRLGTDMFPRILWTGLGKIFYYASIYHSTRK